MMPGKHLQDLVLDEISTKDQKAAALSLLRTVVKNLSVPTKSQDSKYRQIRLSNEKVKARLLPCPSAVDYMKAIGFVEISDVDDGSEYLRIEADKEVSVLDMKASLLEVTNALGMVDPEAGIKGQSLPIRKTGSFGEEKKTPEGLLIRVGPSPPAPSVSSAFGNLSEKQKARLLMEKKRLKEKEDAREARKKTAKLIKQDKYVRENDENWTSKQSAACVKTGSSINTFRDKYGEN